jgi:hypothetical protein
MWEIAERVRIDRPVALVQAQFADVAHHAASPPHAGVTFRVLEDSASACEYEQVSRIGPFRSRQRFVLDRTASGFPAHQVNRIVAGPFHGGSVTFDVGEDGDGSVVVATVSYEPGLALRLLGPLISRVLRRSLAGALEEDRIDLESGRYEAAPGG